MTYFGGWVIYIIHIYHWDDEKNIILYALDIQKHNILI